jgi:transcription antitermination factor NusG
MTGNQLLASSTGFTAVVPDDSRWYAVQTRARHEKVVTDRLRGLSLTAFLPLVTEVHRWSDRRKTVQVPLFTSYVFVRLDSCDGKRGAVRQLEGVVNIVGTPNGATPIPDEQIESIRLLLGQNLIWSAHPLLKAGQRVRIRGGALDGVEGFFLSRNGDNSLVVSVDVIQRSLAVRIDGYDVEPL